MGVFVKHNFVSLYSIMWVDITNWFSYFNDDCLSFFNNNTFRKMLTKYIMFLVIKDLFSVWYTEMWEFIFLLVYLMRNLPRNVISFPLFFKYAVGCNVGRFVEASDDRVLLRSDQSNFCKR